MIPRTLIVMVESSPSTFCNVCARASSEICSSDMLVTGVWIQQIAVGRHAAIPISQVIYVKESE